MTPRIVGVIFSRADLRRALRMRTPPDLFELRLDALIDCLGEVRRNVRRLTAPIIITARHPREGGANTLSLRQRRKLLVEFLPRAKYVDVELRSARALLHLLHPARARLIISFHDFDRTPSPARLRKIVESARSLGAHFIKIAVRTDSPKDLATLLDLLQEQPGRPHVVAMGMGKLGRASRRELIRCGCALNYGSLHSRVAPGQLSIDELRRLARRPDAVS